MYKTLLPLFLFISLLILSPISSLANDDEPPIEINIDRSSREELNRFKPSKITPADVKFMEKQFEKLGDKLQDLEGGTINHFTGERTIRDKNGEKMKIRVRGPMAKIRHQTRHFPAEAFTFYSAIGATMAIKAYQEALWMDGRTDPAWLSNLYHELTSPVGLISFYCFLLASGQTGYAFAKYTGLEKHLAHVKAQMAIVQGAKDSGQITKKLLKRQKRLQTRLSWHNTIAGQVGLAMGIFASNVVTESYYVMQGPAWDHCIKELFRKNKTLNSQNKSLQCDILADEAWNTFRSWGPAVLSVLSASLISSAFMQGTQLNKGVKKLNKLSQGIKKDIKDIATQDTSVKKQMKVPFISNLNIKYSPTALSKWKKYAALAFVAPKARAVQWGAKFINLVVFMLTDQHITTKFFESINEDRILGDLGNDIDDFIAQYAQMDPVEDGLVCETNNDCEYHPILVSVHKNAQQFSRWRQYKSEVLTGAHHTWLMYINKAIGAAMTAQQTYTQLVQASTDLHANFNKEHYFISEEDSFTDYKATLITDMRKTQTEISELEENIARLEKSLEELSEEEVSEETALLAKEKIDAITESQKQIAWAKKFNLFSEALDELKEYKNTNEIRCQNQNLNLQLVSPDISPHPDYYFLTLRNSRFHLWTDAERACILEAMFNTIYSSNNIASFYADINSAQQQAENIIRTTMGGISEAEELRTWSRDLLRKKVLSAGLELLGTISIQMRRKINDEAHIPVIDSYIPRSDKRQKRIDDQIAQNIFVKLHEKMKVIRSYPRGELYTQKINDHYNKLAEQEGHQYIPALFDFNIFRNDRMTDFMLSSFLCGENKEIFKNINIDQGGWFNRLEQGDHWTDIADDDLSAVSRTFNGTFYTSVLPRFPALKLSDQELSQLCSEHINTISTRSGESISHLPVKVGDRSYPNLLHLVLNNIDVEKLGRHVSPFIEKANLENMEMLQSNIDEWTEIYNESLNSSSIEEFIEVNKDFILEFYYRSNGYIRIAGQAGENGELTDAEKKLKQQLYNSILNKIENNQFAEISHDEINDFEQTLAQGINNSTETLENRQASNIDDTIKTMEPTQLFSIWWQHTIVPSIKYFLQLSIREFESMRNYQFPGPLFQNTVSEVDIAIDRTFDFAQAPRSTHSSQDTEEIKPTELFPSLVANNQLNSSVSISRVMTASPSSSYSAITTHKHTLKVPEGIFSNIHFEMTYWADLILNMATRKKELDPDATINLATLKQQLNTFIDLYDVDKITYDIQQQSMQTENDMMEPFNPEDRESIQLCHDDDDIEGAWLNHITWNPIIWLWRLVVDSFKPVQVSRECSFHYDSFYHHWFDKDESFYFEKKRCLRANYLPKKMGEQFSIDINVLHSRQMDSNYDRQIGAFTENEIHENTSSNSDTLLDQLLKYALLRLNALEVEMSQAIMMRWDSADKQNQHKNIMLNPIPSTMNPGKNSCDNYIEEFDELIDFKVEQATEEAELAKEAQS